MALPGEGQRRSYRTVDRCCVPWKLAVVGCVGDTTRVANLSSRLSRLAEGEIFPRGMKFELTLAQHRHALLG